MAVKHVIEGVHGVSMGKANAFLIESQDGLTLNDAGSPHKEATVFEAIRGLGHRSDELKHLIFTHGHPEDVWESSAES
jgi:glyoxylase-like metal-dependent hydrolase (beta-lactamase superfamily II)